MEGGLLYGFTLEESRLFGEGIEHLGGGVVGGGIAYLIAVRYCDGHTSIFYYIKVLLLSFKPS